MFPHGQQQANQSQPHHGMHISDHSSTNQRTTPTLQHLQGDRIYGYGTGANTNVFDPSMRAQDGTQAGNWSMVQQNPRPSCLPPHGPLVKSTPQAMQASWPPHTSSDVKIPRVGPFGTLPNFQSSGNFEPAERSAGFRPSPLDNSSFGRQQDGLYDANGTGYHAEADRGPSDFQWDIPPPPPNQTIRPNPLSMGYVDHRSARGGSLSSPIPEQRAEDQHDEDEIEDEDADDVHDDLASEADDDGFRADWSINSVAEARAKPYPRTMLKVKAGDDWLPVKKSKLAQKHWVQRLINAFHANFKAAPPAKKAKRDVEPSPYTFEELTRFTGWQQDFEKLANEILDDEELKGEDVRAAWLVLGEVLDTHRYGYYRTGYPADKTTKFSDRMSMIESAISDYPAIRYDLLKGESLAQLAVHPYRYKTQKLGNLWGNYRKAVKDRERKDLRKEKARADAEANGEDFDSEEWDKNEEGHKGGGRTHKDDTIGVAVRRKKAAIPRKRRTKVDRTAKVEQPPEDAAEFGPVVERDEKPVDPSALGFDLKYADPDAEATNRYP